MQVLETCQSLGFIVFLTTFLTREWKQSISRDVLYLHRVSQYHTGLLLVTIQGGLWDISLNKLQTKIESGREKVHWVLFHTYLQKSRGHEGSFHSGCFGDPCVVQPAFYYPFCNTPLSFKVNNKHLRNIRLQPLKCKCSWTQSNIIIIFLSNNHFLSFE